MLCQFQMHRTVIRHYITYKLITPISLAPTWLPTELFHVTYYISYLVQYIPMTIFTTANLYFLISFTFFAQPPTPSHLPIISLLSISMSLFLFCLFAFVF